MTRHCRSCGADITTRPPKHFLCLRCFGDAARRIKTSETAPSRIFGLTCDAVGFDADKATKLIKLAHPDKHGGDKTATELTQWLIDVRSQLTKEERQNG
jgi:hypothetical protein